MKLSLSMKILGGLILGVLMGLLIGDETIFVNTMKLIGTLFINLCKMVLIPLVFSGLVVSAASIRETRKLGRIGLKAGGYYLLITALAVTLGLVLANLVDPGRGLTLPTATEYLGKDQVPLDQVLLAIIPVNPLAALVEGNMLQIIFFAIFWGMAISSVGDKAKPVHQFFTSLAELMYKITDWLMALAPFGVFALIVPVASSYGVTVLLPTLSVIITIYAACLLHAAIVYSLAVRTLAGMSPWQFFKGLTPAMLVAFSTCSSISTLPITMRTVEERLGVSREVTSFVLSLGAIINMDGTAIYHGVCAVFIAQIFGLELTFSQQLITISIATLASLGTAGVPGASLITLTLILKSLGLPLEGMVLIVGINPLLDMIKTLVNVTGNACAAVVVESSEQGYLILSDRLQKFPNDVDSPYKSS